VKEVRQCRFDLNFAETSEGIEKWCEVLLVVTNSFLRSRSLARLHCNNRTGLVSRFQLASARVLLMGL
jgi:hypothetical protein